MHLSGDDSDATAQVYTIFFESYFMWLIFGLFYMFWAPRSAGIAGCILLVFTAALLTCSPSHQHVRARARARVRVRVRVCVCVCVCVCMCLSACVCV